MKDMKHGQAKSKETPRKRKSRLINVQRHRASCGPIAVANALKWSGTETSYDAVLRFCYGICAYHPRAGMWPFQMRYALRILGLKYSVRRNFTAAELEHALDDECAIILVYETKKNHSHAVFIDAHSKIGYRVWNCIKGHGPWYYKKLIRKFINRSLKSKKLYAFIIKPEGQE